MCYNTCVKLTKTNMGDDFDKERAEEDAAVYDYCEKPERLNEIRTPLEGEELGMVRYEDLASSLKSRKETNEATFRFQWKSGNEQGYVANEDLMEVKGTLNPLNGSLKLEGAGWSATINPDGTIEGDMPDKLLELLSYDRVEYDEKTCEGETTSVTHKVEFIKKNGLGRLTSVVPIYRDTEGENAEEVLKSLDDQ